jgi:transposase
MLDPKVNHVVGIDVAKASHVVCALEVPSGKVCQRPKSVAATAEGYADLVEWLAAWGGPEAVLIGLEATGCLWEPLYDALTRADYRVLVLNPRQTSYWSASLGMRAKTDGIDAQTIARGLLAGYARASTLPSETVQALRELTRARRDLVQSRTAARQRLLDELIVVFPELPSHLPDNTDLANPAILHLLGSYGSAQALAAAPLAELTALLTEQSGGRWGEEQARQLQAVAKGSAASTRAVMARAMVVATFARHILELQRHVYDLEKAITTVLRDDEASNRLLGVPGVGRIHAATIRAELGDVARFDRVDQVVAYAGLEPRVRQSGAFVGQCKISKRGPGALRHALYMATLAAASHYPEWNERYKKLLAKGNAKKEALTILSRAFLKMLYHLLASGESYDPTKINPTAVVAVAGT